MINFKKYRYFIIVGLLVVVIGISFISNSNQNDLVYKDEKLEDVVEDSIEEVDEQTITSIKVDIKGAVNKPGVYELEYNSRVSDAIEASGGLTKDADTSMINLSKNLSDEMVIIIYTKDEIEEMKSGNTSIKYIEKECICPEIENDACIEEVIDNKEEVEKDGKVSLNNASLEELMTLDGIGESKAKAIIEYRNKNEFKSIEEIMEVNGIGTATYEKIKDKLTL